MLKAEQIPDEVVEAALKKRGLMREAIADALNAWPGMEIETVFVDENYLILPVPPPSAR